MSTSHLELTLRAKIETWRAKLALGQPLLPPEGVEQLIAVLDDPLYTKLIRNALDAGNIERQLQSASFWLDQGEIDDAFQAIETVDGNFSFVFERVRSLLYRPIVTRGINQPKHASEGGKARAAAHGWERRAPELQQAMLAIRHEHPKWGWTRVRQEVASRLGCSLSTVKNYTTVPPGK